jgi:hypothetical protein
MSTVLGPRETDSDIDPFGQRGASSPIQEQDLLANGPSTPGCPIPSPGDIEGVLDNGSTSSELMLPDLGLNLDFTSLPSFDSTFPSSLFDFSTHGNVPIL